MQMSISDIKKKFNSAKTEELPNIIREFEADGRKGVINLREAAIRRYNRYLMEKQRLFEIMFFEREGYKEGAKFIGGIDEVGRGPLAGPVVSAIVILKEGVLIEEINDSKKLSPKKRDELYDEIIKNAVDYSIGIVSHEEIDEINILQATYKAMRQALDKIEQKPDYLLVDAVTIPLVDIKQKGIVKGDAKSQSIAAASIVAKVTRDRLMEEYAKVYPDYDFENNKGYGSQSHIEAIKKNGICPIHRKSFVKNFMTEQGLGKEVNKEKGNYGENLAVKMLKKRGYKIIERNYKNLIGEIDIIAEDGEYTVFVEVKFRSDISKGRPVEAVDYRKQKKIVLVAKEYISSHKIWGRNFRFDVVEVLNGNPPMGKIIRNAFGE